MPAAWCRFFDICVAHQPAPCLVQAQQSYAPRLFARLALTPDATPPTIFANRLLSNCLVRARRRNHHEEEILHPLPKLRRKALPLRPGIKSRLDIGQLSLGKQPMWSLGTDIFEGALFHDGDAEKANPLRPRARKQLANNDPPFWNDSRMTVLIAAGHSFDSLLKTQSKATEWAKSLVTSFERLAP